MRLRIGWRTKHEDIPTDDKTLLGHRQRIVSRSKILTLFFFFDRTRVLRRNLHQSNPYQILLRSKTNKMLTKFK